MLDSLPGSCRDRRPINKPRSEWRRYRRRRCRLCTRFLSLSLNWLKKAARSSGTPGAVIPTTLEVQSSPRDGPRHLMQLSPA